MKRMDPVRPLPLVFYAFAVKHLPAGWETAIKDWAAIIAGMAVMAPSIHKPDTGFGKALADADFSEARLERLLAADGDTKRTLFLRAVRLLSSKSIPFNWFDAVTLLLYKDPEKVEKMKLSLARDFYLQERARK